MEILIKKLDFKETFTNTEKDEKNYFKNENKLNDEENKIIENEQKSKKNRGKVTDNRSIYSCGSTIAPEDIKRRLINVSFKKITQFKNFRIKIKPKKSV